MKGKDFTTIKKKILVIFLCTMAIDLTILNEGFFRFHMYVVH
jgi:hypothetical protein